MLQLENLVIVKLGGSVITHKESSPPTVNEEHLSRIAKELLVHDGKLIVVLGGDIKYYLILDFCSKITKVQ